MEWINISKGEPKKYEEVIICTDTGKVKSAIYFGNAKWSTYMPVVLWMSMPEAPVEFLTKNEETEPIKKKRGRRKVSE